jgi:hypothetical protein
MAAGSDRAKRVGGTGDFRRVDNRTDIAAAVWVEKFQQWRITLLPGVLQAAALRLVQHSPFDPRRYPAQMASGDGAIWFVDAAAQES